MSKYWDSIKIYRNSSTTFDVNAKKVVMQGSGIPDITSDIVVIVNTGVIGVNGMDVLITPTTDQWFHIHAISNGTTSGAIISQSQTTPTLPTGYTNSKWLGPVQYNTAAYGWIEQIQNDNRINMQDRGILVGGVSANAANTYQSISFPQAVPACAKSISGYMAGARGRDGQMAISPTGTDMGRYTHNATGFPDTDGVGVSNCFCGLELVTPQTLYWKSFDSLPRNDLYLNGYLI